MSEAELVDSAIGYAANGASYFALWLTVLSAYAVTAYFVGKSFTTFQAAWLNTLYLFASLLTIFGFYSGYRSKIYYIKLLKGLNGGRNCRSGVGRREIDNNSGLSWA